MSEQQSCMTCSQRQGGDNYPGSFALCGRHLIIIKSDPRLVGCVKHTPRADIAKAEQVRS